VEYNEASMKEDEMRESTDSRLIGDDICYGKRISNSKNVK
jgi:hypothetical protein